MLVRRIITFGCGSVASSGRVPGSAAPAVSSQVYILPTRSFIIIHAPLDFSPTLSTGLWRRWCISSLIINSSHHRFAPKTFNPNPNSNLQQPSILLYVKPSIQPHRKRERNFYFPSCVVSCSLNACLFLFRPLALYVYMNSTVYFCTHLFNNFFFSLTVFFHNVHFCPSLASLPTLFPFSRPLSSQSLSFHSLISTLHHHAYLSYLILY